MLDSAPPTMLERGRHGAMAFGLLCTMRDEAPFLLEWLAYHQVIGFDRIVVFSNDCTDGTDALLAELDASGQILHVPHNPDPTESVARTVAKHAIEERHFDEGDWVVWLDADEFLNVHLGGGQVSDLVAALGDAEGICVSWRLFGDAGRDDFPNGFISDDFVRCAKPNDGWMNVKTVFRQSRHVAGYFQHRPVMRPAFWKTGHFLSGRGTPLSADGRHSVMWRQGQRRGKIDNHDAGWDWAQINHYAVRTPKHYARKRMRGRIGVPQESGAERYTDAYYDELNKNESEDRSILRWQEAVQGRMQELQSMISGKAGAAPAKRDVARYQAMHAAHAEEIDARRYANKKLADAIVELTDPETVIDVGCGIGVLMSELQAQGVSVAGVEGVWLEDDATVCGPNHYIRSDLEAPLHLEHTYDVCVSIEVAEHLEKGRAAGFVTDLCRLSEIVVFSAAVPGQGGKGHKNEQWQEYWAELFVDEGYTAYDVFRPGFRNDLKMLPWYRQNVLLFIKDGHLLSGRHIADRASPAACNMILPEYHRKVLRRTRRAFREKLAAVRATVDG